MPPTANPSSGLRETALTLLGSFHRRRQNHGFWKAHAAAWQLRIDEAALGPRKLALHMPLSSELGPVAPQSRDSGVPENDRTNSSAAIRPPKELSRLFEWIPAQHPIWTTSRAIQTSISFAETMSSADQLRTTPGFGRTPLIFCGRKSTGALATTSFGSRAEKCQIPGEQSRPRKCALVW